jgi:hypothetical protein
MSTYADQPIVVGDVIDFNLASRKNDVDWPSSSGVVLLYLRKPDGTWLDPFTATITATGVAHYQIVDTVLDVAGQWRRRWKLSESGIIMSSRNIGFRVEDDNP